MTREECFVFFFMNWVTALLGRLNSITCLLLVHMKVGTRGMLGYAVVLTHKRLSSG